MRTVLYANDMEPITVLELSAFTQKYLIEQGLVHIAVMEPPRYQAIPDFPLNLQMRSVTIRAEKFIRRGENHMLLFTNDEESALLLKCAFLPGQQAELNQRDRKAFASGFLDALYKLGAS